ncbi:MAG: STAS domain-containing protein [Thermoplasmatota archaeon]
MEFKRCKAEREARWALSGELDDDSFLHLESLIMNSQDRGKDIELDLSGIMSISMTGAGGLRKVARRMSNSGSELKLVGANKEVRRKLEVLGLMGDP